jgi:hypothetical protein
MVAQGMDAQVELFIIAASEASRRVALAFHEFLIDEIYTDKVLISQESLAPVHKKWGEEVGLPEKIEDTREIILDAITTSYAKKGTFVGIDEVENPEAFMLAMLNEYGRADYGIAMGRLFTNAIKKFMPIAGEIMREELKVLHP